MPYEYLDHVADVGLRATGATLAEALESAAQGLLDLQVDTTTVEDREQASLVVRAGDPGALLVAFLNAIIAEQDIRRWFFRSVRVDDAAPVVSAAGPIDGGWRVAATLAGEPIDLARHAVFSEVKAATYSGLRAEIAPDSVLLQCVLDL